MRLLKQILLAVDVNISRHQVKTLERLVRQVQGYELFMGTDMFGDPKLLPGLLADLERANGSSQQIQV